MLKWCKRASLPAGNICRAVMTTDSALTIYSMCRIRCTTWYDIAFDLSFIMNNVTMCRVAVAALVESYFVPDFAVFGNYDSTQQKIITGVGGRYIQTVSSRNVRIVEKVVGERRRQHADRYRCGDGRASHALYILLRREIVAGVMAQNAS
eukprot:14339181-Heterocapsa_arctica.AAC.1